MSTGPQAAFIQGHQSTMEQDTSHSALLYLFQEVSKLASPIHNSVLDTHSTSTWLNETSRQGPFIVKNEEDAQSIKISNTSCQHSLSCLSPYNQMKKVKRESHSSKDTDLVEPHPGCNSPWKVLSLINLQCERLLHHSDVEETDQSSVSSATKLSDSIDNALTTIAEETDQVGKSHYERQINSAGVSPGKDVRGVCSEGADGCKPQCCVKDSQEGFCSQSPAPERTDTVGPELVEENALASSQPQHRDKTEVKLSVNRQFGRNQDCKDCFSSEPDIMNFPFCENASVATLLTSNSNEETSTDLLKPAPTLDHNANLVFTTEPPSDSQLTPLSSVLPSSQSASFLLSTFKNYHLLSNKDDKITAPKPESTCAPIEETSKLEARAVQEEDIAAPCAQQWRTKTPRKQPNPSRSADIKDPDFQGVTFRMDTELDDSKAQSRLLITSKYSRELCKSVRKPRLRTRTDPKSLKTSSSDEESDPTTSVSKGKVCASCCTRKTPMWRDAEDGTPLCNACGIRYKKYRVRCVSCWHIPRKEGNSNSCCLKCGNFVKLTSSSQRKHTT